LTAKYCLEKEDLVQELLKEFGDDTVQSLHSFFYVFAKEFVTQLQMSFAELDIIEIENDVVKKILLKEEPLEPAHAQTLYFIVGFVASAVKKEGIHRQKNGFLFKVFAERNCLTKAGIAKAWQLGMLPMQRTDRVNKGGLHYSTLHLYKTMVIVEQIYCVLLTDDNLLAFGPVALKRHHERISADDKICSLLACALGKNGNGVDEVVDYALRTFACIRGSDYASKLLF
jgi:hypothetical protein